MNLTNHKSWDQVGPFYLALKRRSNLEQENRPVDLIWGCGYGIEYRIRMGFRRLELHDYNVIHYIDI
jgi:hypothetical protein